MALKKKNLTADGAGAALLPRLMTETPAPGEGPVELPLDSLQPAPAAWNFYSPLPDDKMLELIASIRDNGLLHPILVWQRPGQPDTVLSGHNRLEAFRRLYKATGEEQYARIPCTLRRDLTEAQAREIIVDSNWVQRNLTPSEKARSICQKYALAGRKRRAANGSAHESTYEIIAREYGLSGRQIARYVKLGSLSDELLALLDSGKLGVAAGVRLADLEPAAQDAAARLIAERGIRPAQAAQLRPDMTAADLETLLAPPPPRKERTVTVSVTMPARLREEFLDNARAWLEERGVRL